MENLLKEEDSVVQRRLQARKALNDVKASLYQVGSWPCRGGHVKRRTTAPSCLVLFLSAVRMDEATLWSLLPNVSHQLSCSNRLFRSVT